MEKESEPIQLTIRKNDTADEAWFYRNKKSIEVCIYKRGQNPLTVTVPLSKIAPKGDIS